MAARLAVAACAVALYQHAAQVPEPMDRDAFARVGRQVRSDALEAAGLARALAAGQLTAHYAKAQHEALSQDLDDARRKLDRPAPTGEEDAANHLREAIERLDDAIAGVPVRMADAAALARIAEDEAAIAREIPAAGAR